MAKKNLEVAADGIIRNHVVWSMGAGLIPVLVADIFAVTAIQLDMIRQMCKVYDIPFEETQGKAVVTALTSSTLARIGASSLIKAIPGLGTLIGGATVSIFAGASTYALGEVFKQHFETGGTFLDFDPARFKKFYKEKFEKGKQVAKDMNKRQKEEENSDAYQAFKTSKTSTESPVPQANTAPKKSNGFSSEALTRLKELGDLRDSGILTEEEFQDMKKRIIKNA